MRYISQYVREGIGCIVMRERQGNDWWQLVGCYEYNIDQSRYLPDQRIYTYRPTTLYHPPHVYYIQGPGVPTTTR